MVLMTNRCYAFYIVAAVTLKFAGSIKADNPAFIRQCGAWGIDHARNHSHMLLGDAKNQKYLVAVPHASGKMSTTI